MPNSTRSSWFAWIGLTLLFVSLALSALSAARPIKVLDSAMAVTAALALIFGLLGWRHRVGKWTVVAICLMVAVSGLVYSLAAHP